jgi:hypothetical protein
MDQDKVVHIQDWDHVRAGLASPDDKEHIAMLRILRRFVESNGTSTMTIYWRLEIEP